MKVTLRNCDFYDVKELARLMRKTPRMVRYDLERGKLRGVKLAGTWVIPGENVKNLEPKECRL